MARLLEDCRIWLLIPLAIVIWLVYDAYMAITTPFEIPIVFPFDFSTFFRGGIGRFLVDFLLISVLVSVTIELYWNYGRHPKGNYS